MSPGRLAVCSGVSPQLLENEQSSCSGAATTKPCAASSVRKIPPPIGLPPSPCEKMTSGWRRLFAAAIFAGAPTCGLASTSGCWFGRAGYQMSLVNFRVCPSDNVLVNALEVKPTAGDSVGCVGADGKTHETPRLTTSVRSNKGSHGLTAIPVHLAIR